MENLSKLGEILPKLMTYLTKIRFIMSKFGIEDAPGSEEYYKNFFENLINTKTHVSSSSGEYDFLCIPVLGLKNLNSIGPPEKREVIFFTYISS